MVVQNEIKVNQNGTINVVLTKSKVRKNEKEENSNKIVANKVEEHSALVKLEDELKSLIGLEEIKKILKEIYAWIYINRKRSEHGLKDQNQVLHMMFRGNPGTGKTTIARIIAKVFQEMKVLSKGHLVEVERADLVGEYIGHTAIKTRDLVKKAIGGVLFIDEAYSLGRGGEKDFGKEAIDTLVSHMENKQHDFILILAGYDSEMNRFLRLNTGLESRFPFIIDFPDYDVGELLLIAKKMYDERQYVLSNDAYEKFKQHLQTLLENDDIKLKSNGRYIRNIVERSIRQQANRLLYTDTHTKTDLMQILSSDINFN
ncbi:MAG: Sporulation stage protein [Bacillales bacterium]|jgi:stage V sporulation protein K|nr:Sporulation stage protein [Bacillales bacterium]